MSEKNEGYSLLELIKNGGVYYRVEGTEKQQILSNLINELQELTLEKKEELLKAVLEREALMSTGIDCGIALPHPRTPLLAESENPFIVIGFPEKPIDWGTPDNELVHSVFLIVSKSAKQHLNALTKINFLCMNENFYSLISKQAGKEELLNAIEEAEKGWKK